MTTCNAIIGTKVREFGFEWVTCRQVVGVRSYISSGGLRVGYCSKDGHEASVRRQFAEQADIPEPDWDLPEHADDMTFAKWSADREASDVTRWGA